MEILEVCLIIAVISLLGFKRQPCFVNRLMLFYSYHLLILFYFRRLIKGENIGKPIRTFTSSIIKLNNKKTVLIMYMVLLSFLYFML